MSFKIPTNEEIKDQISKSLQDALEKHILPQDERSHCRLKLSLMLKRLGLTDETEIETRLKKNMKSMIQDMMTFGQAQIEILTKEEAEDALKPDRRAE